VIRFLFPGSVLVYLALILVAAWFFGLAGIVGIVLIMVLLAKL